MEQQSSGVFVVVFMYEGAPPLSAVPLCHAASEHMGGSADGVMATVVTASANSAIVVELSQVKEIFTSTKYLHVRNVGSLFGTI